MKTMRPNLTIQLNRSRKNSSLDINNGQSGFMTPTDQTISTPAHPPPNPQYFPSTYLQHGHSNLHHSNQHHHLPHQSQPQNYDASDVITPVVSRNDSSFSLYSDDEQMGEAPPPQQTFQQPQLPQPNLTRTSSIASSVTGDNYVSNINFTKNFDALIMSTYQSYVNKPEITPFDPKYPPSGIASRVSRDVLKLSINDRIAIDNNLKKTEELWLNINLSYTLTVIRKRLFELCETSHGHYGSVDETPIEMPSLLSRTSSSVAQHQLQRQNSVSSLTFPAINSNDPVQQLPFQQISQHKPSWLHLNSSFMTHRLSSTDSLVENVNLGQPSLPNSRSNSIHQFNGKLLNTPPTLSSLSRWTSNDTDFEMKKDEFPSHQSNLFQPPHFPNSSNLTPPQQLAAQLEDSHQLHDVNHLESPFHPSFNLINATNNSGLQSPFAETFGKSKMGSDLEAQDPLYNATHNRKRDSLIKKRSGK